MLNKPNIVQMAVATQPTEQMMNAQGTSDVVSLQELKNATNKQLSDL